MRMRAECLRAGALRLCLALMLGLLVVSGYVVAPQLFAHADSAATAGMLAGHIFHQVNNGVLILGIAVLLFWLRVGLKSRLRWGLLAAVLLLVAVNAFALAPWLAALKAQAGDITKLAADDPLRARFGMGHGISAVIHMLASLLAAWLVALGAEGACRRS